MTAASHRTGRAVPPRSATLHGRALAVLGAAASALVAAFVVVPGTLAASGPGEDFGRESELADALRAAFVAYWNSGERAFPPDLDALVDYWFRYHVAKAVIAALLLSVLVAAGTLLWKAFLRADGPGAGKRFALASAGVLTTLLALLSLAAVMANVQGAAAPFASLLPLLPTGATGAADGALGAVLAQVGERLAVAPGAGEHAPAALDVMIGDFARYHEAMAAIAATVAVVLAVMSVPAWRRFGRTGPAERRTRRTLGSFGALAASAALLVMVVAVANTTTAAAPRPALLAFFEGGW
ncbi:hypothetical protein [Streptomyces litmocidini]|uniref:Tat (Twin-arginine translocation) pathway signal sequence n=1 Tax=Streptomyces litmocidini TaxID=67318 RepID=A0ABW7UGQ6_9ACTN